MKVLVVDDDAIQHAIVRLFFKRFNITVITACCGLEGLEMAKTNAPDCIIIDYQLGDMNGIDLLEELRLEESLKSVPLIMVTSELKNNIRKMALDAGAVSVMQKPIRSAEIEQIYHKIESRVA